MTGMISFVEVKVCIIVASNFSFLESRITCGGFYKMEVL